MRRKNRRKFGICAYCGEEKIISMDHIPPQCLFSKPLPKHMITVPKCDDCYPGASNDDENFCQKLSLRLDTFEHEEVKKIWPRIQRAFENPEKIGMKKTFINAIRDVEISTPGGIYLGNVCGYYVDLVPIYRVIERISKGLFYRQKKRCLPDTYGVRAFILNESQRKRVLTSRVASKLITIGNGVFSYCFLQPFADRNITLNLLLFYESMAFFGITFSESV